MTFNTYYEKYIEKIKERATDAVKQARKQTFIEFFQFANIKILNMFYDSVDEFYSNYSPIYYEGQRRYSLYNVIQTKVGDDYFSISFDPSAIRYRDGSGGEEGDLYDLVFRQGYHGGATSDKSGLHPNPGVPYWRKPVPYYTHWGRPAVQSKSPLLSFQQKVADYQDGQYQKDYQNIWNKNKSKIKIKM